MDYSIEPPSKKPKPSPLSLLTSLPSLPEEIVLSILARIPRSYYPKLSLISKRFHGLSPSRELDKVRSHLGIREICVYVGLQSPTHPYDRRWFSLWIKPNDHQTLRTTRNRLLLPTPSSYSSCLPISTTTIDSKRYNVGGQNNSPASTNVYWVYNEKIFKEYKSPSMTVARKNALTCSHDGKLYVMAGCDPDQSTHWAEVFDTKTQTWEPLPDPGYEIRFSPLTMLIVGEGHEIYLKTNNYRYFVYLIKERKWKFVIGNVMKPVSACEIDQVSYQYDNHQLYWYDSKSEELKPVYGLYELCWFDKTDTKIGSYGEKLVMLWLGPRGYIQLYQPEIWCAMISLEKRDDGEIWGEIEWTDRVLTLPMKFEEYALSHYVELLR